MADTQPVPVGTTSRSGSSSQFAAIDVATYPLLSWAADAYERTRPDMMFQAGMTLTIDGLSHRFAATPSH